MLSGHERRVLSAIEQHLSAEDPALCRVLRGGPDAVRRRWQLIAAVLTMAMGGMAALVGMVSPSPVMVLLGVMVMAAGWAAVVVVRGQRDGDGARRGGGGVAPT